MKDMIAYFFMTVVVMGVVEGCRSKVVKSDTTSSLPIPYPKYMVITDPATITVRWDPVKVSADNPILGFKIKLWEEETIKVIKFVEKDGEQAAVEELVPIKKPFHELPTHKPAFEAVLPPDVFMARFDVKLGVHYEVSGQSFNADGDGPLFRTHGFAIQPFSHTTTSTEAVTEDTTNSSTDPEDQVKVIILRDMTYDSK